MHDPKTNEHHSIISPRGAVINAREVSDEGLCLCSLAVLCVSPVMKAGVPVLRAGWDRLLGACETDKRQKMSQNTNKVNDFAYVYLFLFNCIISEISQTTWWIFL